MRLGGVVPPADLLSQIEGIEAGLRQIRRLGRLGSGGSALAGLYTVAGWIAAQSGLLDELEEIAVVGPALSALLAVSVWVLPIFVLLFAWSRVWLKQSRAPFRYTCFIGPFTAVEHSTREEEKISWLGQDLAGLLSQRVGRLLFLDRSPTDGADDDAGEDASTREAHVEILGHYVIRPQAPSEDVAVEIMPRVGIGVDSAKTLAYPVRFPETSLLRVKPAGHGEPLTIDPQGYSSILERVYFSVATEIYRRIESDVEHKIALMPTAYLRGLSLFHEAEDYSRSNTLRAHEQAGRLYLRAAQELGPMIREDDRWSVERLRSIASSRWRRIRLHMARVAPRLAAREVMYARAQIGYANSLIFRRALAAMTGQRRNPAFEARPRAKEALQRLESLPDRTPGRRKALFDTYVTLALAHAHLDDHGEAETWLTSSRALDPARSEIDPQYLMAAAVVTPHLRTELTRYRQAVERQRRFDWAQVDLATRTESLWRRRAGLARVKAALVLHEYQKAIELNPGNVMAWANSGYVLWLLGDDVGDYDDLTKAAGQFAAGRDYKAVRAETFVSELDYGLARIAAEQGDFEQAYRHYVEAVAGLAAQASDPSGSYTSYYFSDFTPAIQDRFDRYLRQVEEKIEDRWGDDPPDFVRSVQAFVFNDYGECCHNNWLRRGDDRWLNSAEVAYERAIERNDQYALPYYNLLRLRQKRSRTPATDCKEKLRERQPEWQPGILAGIETEALTAKAALTTAEVLDQEIAHLETEISDTNRALTALREEIAQLETEISDTKRALTAPGQSVSQQPESSTSVKSSKEAGTVDPAVQSMRERIERRKTDLESSQERKAEKVERRKQCLADVVEAVTNIVCDAATLSPHDWLWIKNDEGRVVDFRWDVLDDRLPSSLDRWVQDLDGLNVEALISFGEALLQIGTDTRAADVGPSLHNVDTKVARLYECLSEHFLPNDVRLLDALRAMNDDEKVCQIYETAVQKKIDRWLQADPYAYWALTWVPDHFSGQRRLQRLADAAEAPGLAPRLYMWLGERLARAGQEEPGFSAESGIAARGAYGAAINCEETSAAELWNLSKLFDVELADWTTARDAVDRGMTLDLGAEQPHRPQWEWRLRRGLLLFESDRHGALREFELVGEDPTARRNWTRDVVDEIAIRIGADAFPETNTTEAYHELRDWLARERERARSRSDLAVVQDVISADLAMIRAGYPALVRGGARDDAVVAAAGVD